MIGGEGGVKSNIESPREAVLKFNYPLGAPAP